MRYYGFGNYYLSSIQQGIQAAHCIADMFVKYARYPLSEDTRMLYNWAENHKTMVLLSGGNSDDLKALFQKFAELHLLPCGSFKEDTQSLPWGSFKEDTQSLNDAVTHVGIIVPEIIYELATYLRGRGTNVQDVLDNGGYGVIKPTNAGPMRVFYKITEAEADLATLLNQYQLAR
jgi:hypothetical protein